MKLGKRASRSLLLFLAVMLHFAVPVRAEVAAKDVLVAVRTLGFVANPPVGSVDLAVLFDPNKPDSLADLQIITDVILNPLVIGAFAVRLVPLSVTDLEHITSFRFVFLTTGLDSFLKQIADLTRNQGILTMTTELTFVREGFCVMGVTTQPRVQILVSRSAANAALVKFASPFLLMITEL